MKWMVEFDVESHIVIEPKAFTQPIVFNDPSSRYTIEISNRSITPGIDIPLLRMCVIFKQDDKSKVAIAGDNFLSEFLDTCALSLASKLKIHKIVRFMDWEPGKTKRSFTQFIENSNPEMPMYGLTTDTIDTVQEFMKFQHDDEFKKASRWFRRGVNSNYVEEQFQNFWFAIEVLAQRNKSSEKVADKCQKCKKPLYCNHCNEVSMHKPFSKQAVEELIRKHSRGRNIDDFIEIAFKTRNALLHGEFAEEVNKKIPQSMQVTTDILGSIARSALLSSIKLEGDGTEKRLSFLEPNTFAHFAVRGTAHGTLDSGTANGDKPNPDDYKGATMEIIVRETP